MNTSDLESYLRKHKLTEQELTSILKSSSGKTSAKKYKLKLPACSFKYGVISDTHIGHSAFDEALFNHSVRVFKKENVNFILHPGDHLEGMSGRPGHIYELNEIGFDKQLKKAVSLYKKYDVPIVGIDGNHDNWFKSKFNMNVVVGTHLQTELKNYVNLGEWEGDIEVNKIKIKLFHANDGSAYALSYKLQKLIESFSGGEKPNILHSGHYHKYMYAFSRNIHAWESGTLCGQSIFMRGKKIAAHKGFSVITVHPDGNTIAKLDQTFYPAYD